MCTYVIIYNNICNKSKYIKKLQIQTSIYTYKLKDKYVIMYYIFAIIILHTKCNTTVGTTESEMTFFHARLSFRKNHFLY